MFLATAKHGRVYAGGDFVAHHRRIIRPTEKRARHSRQECLESNQDQRELNGLRFTLAGSSEPSRHHWHRVCICIHRLSHRTGLGVAKSAKRLRAANEAVGMPWRRQTSYWKYRESAIAFRQHSVRRSASVALSQCLSDSRRPRHCFCPGDKLFAALLIASQATVWLKGACGTHTQSRVNQGRSGSTYTTASYNGRSILEKPSRNSAIVSIAAGAILLFAFHGSLAIIEKEVSTGGPQDPADDCASSEA